MKNGRGIHALPLGGQRRETWVAVAKRSVVWGGLVAASSLANPSFGQDGAVGDPVKVADPVVAPVTSKKTEKIRITGSRIRRTDSEGSSPVTVIDAEQIERSGAPTLAELLRNGTGSPTGNFAGSSGFIRSGSATADLLGIGSGRTLVLLDGKRLPVDQSIGAVNIDNIPLSIIDRIEMLRGGASAVYGADAVGGVVNIITKKNYVGNEAKLNASVPTHGGGESVSAQATSAFTFGNTGNVMITAGLSRTKEILERNRDIRAGVAPRDYTLAHAPNGTFAYRRLQLDDQGDVAGATAWQPSPNCPQGARLATNPDAPQNIYCAGHRKDSKGWFTPRSEEGYVTARVGTSLTSAVDLSAVAIYNQKDSLVNWGNYLVTTENPIYGGGIRLSAAKARALGLEAADGELVELRVRSDDMEDRINRNLDKTYGGNVTLEADLNTWTWSMNLGHFTSTNERYFGNVLNKNNQIALLHSKVDPDYIPIDPNRDNSLLSSIYDDLSSREQSRGNTVDANFSRELFNLPGGPLTIVVGSAYAHEGYIQTPDKRDLELIEDAEEPVYTGTAGVAGEGQRNVSSVYTEVNAPVTPKAEVSLALRADNYSDFGLTTNYSFGSKYKVLDSLLLRFNVASSFRAPKLSDIHRESGGGYVYVLDREWIKVQNEKGYAYDDDAEHQIYVDSPGNEDLDPETGRSYTIGAVMEPFENVSLLVDYIGVHLKDTFSQDDIQDIVDDYYSSGRKNPGINEVSFADEGYISRISAPEQNQGSLEVYAINTDLEASAKAGDFDLGLNTGYFRYLSYRQQDRPDEPIRQLKGYKGYPIWRLNNTFSVGAAGHTVALSSSTIARQTDDPVATEFRQGRRYHAVSEYTRYDASYKWSTQSYDFLLGVYNVMDKLGGLDDSDSLNLAESSTSYLYSKKGRSYFTGITSRF